MILLQMIPVVLSLLLLAAHFLRAELTIVATACVILPALLLRRPWSARAMQLVLVLGAVALFTALSALIFQSRAMSLRFGLRPRHWEH